MQRIRRDCLYKVIGRPLRCLEQRRSTSTSTTSTRAVWLFLLQAEGQRGTGAASSKTISHLYWAAKQADALLFRVQSFMNLTSGIRRSSSASSSREALIYSGGNPPSVLGRPTFCIPLHDECDRGTSNSLPHQENLAAYERAAAASIPRRKSPICSTGSTRCNSGLQQIRVFNLLRGREACLSREARC